jgi:hypothetical protein
MFLIVSSTIGLPLEMLLPLLEKNNMVIDWIDFYNCSIKGGWSQKTTLMKIKTALGDCFGSQYKKEVLKRLYFYLKEEHNGIQ